MGSYYIPPVNFGLVEDNLYRSGQPNELNFPFLEKLRLKKILYLSPEPPPQAFQAFVNDQGIDLQQLGGAGEDRQSALWSPMSEEVVLQALQQILDTENHYPLCLMDSVGRNRVGIVVGCLRKMQRWNLTSIFEEYRRYAGSKVRVLNEQFIELFDTDLVTISSSRKPAWL
mmetsp:Transcript_47532/g.113145  ORF Transcript_47532/g.113145 Transcript_47532/m.113145 type:complete len:171 (+) Transcript_47532:65-577(+)|eukprot:CAMPEP_0180156242 /NCGR_PEP_ID=MMETSP0986-20121125/25427_1 /TAXON_ID=697907 /ORGANISM="non described non described, Strain CCMP2293" /LENGTH=170 /DNA_ID=CAMNT_0022105329 /DNA_START=65 /DNA_END=577 /DNA_ORIENTATION=+